MLINYKLVRARMEMPEAVKKLSVLNTLRVDIEELSYKQNVKQMQYHIARCDYEKYLGYSLNEEDSKKYDEFSKALKNIKID